MKAVKIILAVAVVAIIGFFVWKWFVKIGDVGAIKPPTNQYTARIESEISSLNNTPVNFFCPKTYKDIQYLIKDYHEKDFLGKNESDNNQWEEILSKDLYSAYAPKFADQAMYVFNGSEWKLDDLRFIRNEVKMLQGSEYLEQSSSVSNSFIYINDILKKYDEIAGFISTCNNFSPSYYGVSDYFPNVNDKVQKSRTYINSNLDNSKVNNCERLKAGLREIPKKLFDKHITYLHKKINENGSRYKEFNYQSDYSNTIYTPLKNQIDALDNDVYGVSDNVFENERNTLENLLSNRNRDAVDYFRQLNQQKW